MNIRLRWKKDAPETGLRSVVAGPRGSRLHDGEKTYARVVAFSRYSGKSGWYFVTGWDSGVPHYNSASDCELSEQEAKDAAIARVRRALAASDSEGGKS